MTYFTPETPENVDKSQSKQISFKQSQVMLRDRKEKKKNTQKDS